MDADASVDGNGEAKLDKMKEFLQRLILQQLQGARAAQP